MKFPSSLKKILAFSFSVSLALTPLVSHGQAGGVVTDPGNTAVSAIDAASQSTDVGLSVQSVVKEYGLDSIAFSLASFAGQKLGTLIVNKVTGSASQDEKPNFVTDFNQHFRKEAAKQIGLFSDELLNQYDVGDSPFAVAIADSLVGSFSQSVEEGGLPKFTLKETIGEQWENFTNDAAYGGWAGVAELANPVNTNIGADILAKEEVGRRIAEKLYFEKIKVETGNGFLPDLECEKKAPDYKANDAQFTKTITTEIATDAHDADAFESDTDTETITTTTFDSKADNEADKAILRGAIKENFTPPCLIENIKTPAVTLQSAVDLSTGFAFDKLANANEIGEIVGGIMLSFVSSLAKTGLTSLNVDITQGFDSIGGPEHASRPMQRYNSQPNRIVDLKNELESAILNTKQELELVRKTLLELDKYPSLVTTLEQCIPGPDAGYEKRFNTVFNKKTKKLEKFSNKGSKDKHEQASDALAEAEIGYETGVKYIQISRLNPLWNIPAAIQMQSYGDAFSKKSSEREQVYNQYIEKQTTLSILDQLLLKAKTFGNQYADFPPGFTPAYLASEWNNNQASYALAKRWAGLTDDVPTPEEKAKLVKDYTWTMWDYAGEDETDPDRKETILAEKAAIRGQFDRLGSENISSPNSIQRADLRLDKSVADNTKIQNFTADCNTFRTAIAQMPPNLPGKDVRQRLSDQIANSTLNFVTDEMRTSIFIPQGTTPLRMSILDIDCNNPIEYADCPHSEYIGYNKSQNPSANLSNTQTVSTDDGTSYEYLASDAKEYRLRQDFQPSFQTNAAYDIYTVLQFDTQYIFLCDIPRILQKYPDHEAGGNARERGEPITCSQEWYQLTPAEALIKYYPKTLQYY